LDCKQINSLGEGRKGLGDKLHLDTDKRLAYDKPPMEPRILSIETATHACSVALTCNGDIRHCFEIVPQLHTKRIFPMIRSLLAEAGITMASLDAIAVGRGPGSFTGLRIAVSVAQGLGYGLNKPVYAISTLEAMALQAREQSGETQSVITTLDARMQEVYAGAYTVTGFDIKVIEAEHLLPIEKLDSWIQSFSAPVLHLGSGEGAMLCYPRAKEVAELALAAWRKGEKGLAAEDVLPVYLRDKVAEVPKLSQQAL
jgi:tRNA threonylcarbamoyladenosine biosynthesis protein TsaB